LARLLALGLVVLGSGLGLRDPWPADEPRFAIVARDMALSGDWLIPRVGGEAYADKPPLFMWLIAVPYRLGLDLHIAYLLPSLLAALGTLGLVYDLARRLWGREAAWLASLLLLLTVQFTIQARTAQIDALVCFWITLGVYGLLRHLLLGPHWCWYFVAWFAIGLGIITKGVGFLPMLMFVPWTVVRLRWPERLPRVGASAWRLTLGPLAMLGAIALWLVPMLVHVAQSGSPELAAYRDDILLRQTAQRYANPWHHVQPFWYYLIAVIPWAWLPLSLLFPWLAKAWWRRLKSGEPATWLLLGWAACVLLFFSVTPGKRGVYILPALPALVVAAAPLMAHTIARQNVKQIAVMALTALAIFGAAGAALLYRRTWEFNLWPVMLAGAALATALALLSRRIGSVAALALFIAGSWQLYGWWAAPVIDASRSGRDLMARVSKALPPGTELALAGWKEQLLLHADRPVFHFGFRRASAEETRDAATWLSREENRRLLIPADQMAPCFKMQAGKALGTRHRKEWRLVGSDAINPGCAGETIQRLRYYEPHRGLLLPTSEEESDAASDPLQPHQSAALTLSGRDRRNVRRAVDARSTSCFSPN
jgi:4-amino-4-deoxy-L-arabinose transferase-like glycosyltransferase